MVPSDLQFVPFHHSSCFTLFLFSTDIPSSPIISSSPILRDQCPLRSTAAANNRLERYLQRSHSDPHTLIDITGISRLSYNSCKRHAVHRLDDGITGTKKQRHICRKC